MKNWTVLVYMAGDNGRFLGSLEGEGYADLAEMKEHGSSEAMDVAAQFDSAGHGCQRYHLSRGGDLRADIVQDLGETNSGDPRVLLDFVSWGVRSFPARRHLLVLWNHGSGWRDDDIYAPYRALRRRADSLPAAPPHIGGRRVSRALFQRTVEAIVEEEANSALLRAPGRPLRGAGGAEPPGWLAAPPDGAGPAGGLQAESAGAVRAASEPRTRAICFDDSSKDFLDSRELSQVLEASARLLGKRIDVLGLDACLMSMIEVAYQVRRGADVMVASEDAEPGSGWPYRAILSALAGQPSITPGELGKAVVGEYVASYDRGFIHAEPITQAALKLERADTAAAALDALAQALRRALRKKNGRHGLLQARAQAQRFVDPDYVDLYDFAGLLARETNAPDVQAACQALQASVAAGEPGSLVLADGHAGLAERNAHGISVYFPRRGLSPCYAALDLSRDCAWAQFLEEYVG